MNHKLLSFILLFLCFTNLGLAEIKLEKFSFSKRLMGIDVLIHLYSSDEVTAKFVSEKAFKKIADLEKVFSDYDANSEIRLLSNYQVNKDIQVSIPLMQVLKFSKELHSKSQGAFDPSVRPLSILWRQARYRGSPPPQILLNKALKRVGLQHLNLDEEKQSIRFSIPSMSLDCGAIAKGAIIDEAYKVLSINQHPISLIDAGGDMVIGQSPGDQNGWKIKVEGLKNDEIYLENSSIATSGDRYQNLSFNGHKYSHIIDPRTGMAIKDSHQVTVIAPKAILADGLASTLSLMPPKEALTFLNSYPSCEALLIKERDKITTWSSSGFSKFQP